METSWVTWVFFAVLISAIVAHSVLIGLNIKNKSAAAAAAGDTVATKMVDMSLYWNTVAMPYFFIILGFCLWVLFAIGGAATTDSRHISAAVADAMRIRNAAERRRRPVAAANANEGENPQ